MNSATDAKPEIADAAERELARDPSRSVIVQAPAGSGKTELLMQRYLALLAVVDEPEQILAVTFTRKAAAEMRTRILAALRPADPDKQLPETAALAAKARARDEECGWRLFDYPARLRVRTFDAVNNWLSEAAPVSSGGSGGVVSETVSELYELAARRALERLGDDDALGEHVRLVLRRLDNQADRFIALMAQMLIRRDQWLPLLLTAGSAVATREALESSLRELIERELLTVDRQLSLPARAELMALLPFAAAQNERLGQPNPLDGWQGLTEFPRPEPRHINFWRGLAEFCLVGGKAQFRKTVNKKSGFPTPADGGDAKLTARAKALLESWQGNEALADALHQLRHMPDPRYSDAQWEAVEALMTVLPVVAAELHLVFAERGETDYTQIAANALQALGEPDEPSGLALRLDYQISHILIDEFQDTSRAQFMLLRMLTEGWTGDDGRTLMIVGDPMQSIYRFRQAEVSLYLQLWERGLGNLELDTVKLTTNFRSGAPIVEWVNATFAAMMPADSDPATGAVQFAPGTAYHDTKDTSAVHWHALEEPARVDEATQIAALVKATLEQNPEDTVGILVRTRNQARLIVPQLRRMGIPFSGAGLEQPGETAVEQDLMALTRALSHRGDRTAWLALLRAPWCGLSLHDLNALCGSDPYADVYTQMQDADLLAGLSDEGQQRVAVLRKALAASFAVRGRYSLRDWIEGAWQRLGAPAAIGDARGLELARQFFATLDDFEDGGDIAEAFRLHEQLTVPDDVEAIAGTRVHLLTLYKAKGLEYDVVILPALDGTTRGNEKPVIAWHEYQGQDDQPRYLLGPIESVGDDADPVQQLIRRFDDEQAGNERDRLLYVATTRARRELHLFCGLKRDREDELQKPRNGSLLERMWSVVPKSELNMTGQPGTEEARETWIQPMISRLNAAPADAPAGVTARVVVDEESGEGADEEQPVTFEWAGSDAIRLGLVVHRCLQHMAEQQQPEWQDEGAIERMLREAGVTDAGMTTAAARVVQALRNTRDDERGRWVLSAHAEAACELPVVVARQGRAETLIVDRTFIDEEGVRWIIDYKTSPHEGGDIDNFLAEQKRRYADQLTGYRDALQALEPERTIRTALYFPLQGRLSVYD